LCARSFEYPNHLPRRQSMPSASLDRYVVDSEQIVHLAVRHVAILVEASRRGAQSDMGANIGQLAEVLILLV